MNTEQIEIVPEESANVVGSPGRLFVNAQGVPMGIYIDPRPEDIGADWVEVSIFPDYSDQVWNFETQSWSASRVALVMREDAWRISELPIIARQLQAIEEAAAAEEMGDPDLIPEDLKPGTRNQWLVYRGKVSNWKDGSTGFFPDESKRPVRPS